MTSAPSELTRATTAEFAFHADEEGATLACSLDGGAYTLCTSPASYSGVAEGAHGFAVQATDQAGNTDPTPAFHSWTIDTTPPETTISAGPKSQTTATSASFVFSSGEEGARFECSLDAAEFGACPVTGTYDELSVGLHSFQVRATDLAGNVETTPESRSWEILAGLLMAAGDIACKPGVAVTPTKCRHGDTSNLFMNEPELTNVLALGDLQYEDACYSDFMGTGAYNDTWGRKKAITNPVPGNHEYHDPALCVPVGPGYFQYFGLAAGDPTRGYYSFDLGPWHLIALNSEIPVGPSSPQAAWLTQDLAATTAPCILAYWHKPRFSSGSHGSSTSFVQLWSALYEKRADLVLNGHDHDYERFAPQKPTGEPDDINGVTEFVVGTGGASLTAFNPTPEPNSVERSATDFGVLKLTLHASSYDWEFVPVAGKTFTDRGTGMCH